MKCPFCRKEEIKVIDSREATDVNGIRRRRECLQCCRRFTTFETMELTLQVLKRDGRYEDFQQQKLVNGLDFACRHTTISHEQVVSIAAKISDDLFQKQVPVVSTREIGEAVMEYLESLDLIAYIRFACVYRRFKDIGELTEAIESIHPKEDRQVLGRVQKKIEENSNGIEKIGSGKV